MKRLAVILLAGAALVAAQTTTAPTPPTTPPDNIDQITEQLKEKLHQAYEKAGHDADTARKAAMACQRDMMEKMKADSGKAMEQRRAEANVRLQHAIDAIDRASQKVGTQVQEVRDRIQARLAEKRKELVELQQKILERQAARKAEKESGVEPQKPEGAPEGMGPFHGKPDGAGAKPEVKDPATTTPPATTTAQ